MGAATRLLAEHGYAALRVAAVAKEAGVSLGGQLHHFPSKDSLVVAVLERLCARALDLAVQEASRTRAQDDPFESIAASAQRFFAAPEFLVYLDIFLSVRRHTLVGDTAIRLLHAQRVATEALWLPHFTSRGMAAERATLVIRSIWALARGLAISSSGAETGQINQATMAFAIDALRAQAASTWEAAR
nr:TetR/AcrR family transcriptional regulator [Ramlibacter aurantiacus]